MEINGKHVVPPSNTDAVTILISSLHDGVYEAVSVKCKAMVEDPVWRENPLYIEALRSEAWHKKGLHPCVMEYIRTGVTVTMDREVALFLEENGDAKVFECAGEEDVLLVCFNLE